MKKILVGLIFLAIFGGIGFALFRNREENVDFKTEKITKGEIEATITATGTVNAVTTVLVGTQVSGTIKHIFVDYNSPVKEGQLIAEIDPAPFEAQVEQARANLLQAKANVEKAEAALLDARRKLDRNRQLYSEESIVSKSDLDTSETNYESAKAQVSVAEAQVAQMTAALKYAETNLKYTKILSPVDGIVVQRNVDVGQTVAASFQTPTLFTIAEDLTKMQIDTNVDEADIGKVEVGQEVDFTVDAYPDITFTGKVSQVRIAPIIVQNVVTYNAVIHVDNPGLMLKPGMTANISIIFSRIEDALRIPNAALRFIPPDAGRPSDYEGAGIWILNNGAPARVRVTTGISNMKYTQMVSGDLKDQQEVIVDLPAETKSRARRGFRFF